MKTSEIKMIVNYFDEKMTFSKINEYSIFLKKCKESFKMEKEEIEGLKLYKLDDDNDELLIENEEDFNENLEPNKNNEIIYIIKTKGRKKEQNGKIKIKSISITPQNVKKKSSIGK